jgi:site-specific DNA recombinase
MMAPKRPFSLRSGPASPLTVLRIQQAIAYGRVSSEMQRDSESIKVQVTKLLGTINVRDNPELPDRDQLRLLGAYWDDGVSGTLPLEQRPEGRQLMERICPRLSTKCDGLCGHNGEVDQVWITKLDRLARKLQILIDIEAWLRRHNVSLICMDPSIDTRTGTGRLVFTILASIAEWERETILERTTAGKHHKASEGKWVGGRQTFGLKTDENGYLVIDDTFVDRCGEMAYRVVQSIFENIALHGSTAWKEAQRTGLTERRVGWILHNARYKGEGGIYAKDGSFTAAEKNAPPQLVSPALWQMAQDALITNRAKAGGRHHRTYLLSGLLICCEPYDYISTVDDQGRTRERPSDKVSGQCGRSFAGRAGVNKPGGPEYSYYFCTRTLKAQVEANRNGCTAKMLRSTDVDNAIWNLVKRFVSNPGEVIAEADSGRSDMLTQLNRDLTHVVEQLGQAHMERENVLRSAERGLRTWDEAEARHREISGQIKVLEQQRDAFEMQIRSLSYADLDAQRGEVTLNDISEDLEEIERENNVELKKALIQAVVRRIEVRTVDGEPRLRAMMRFGGDASFLMKELRSGRKPTDDTHMEMSVSLAPGKKDWNVSAA